MQLSSFQSLLAAASGLGLIMTATAAPTATCAASEYTVDVTEVRISSLGDNAPKIFQSTGTITGPQLDCQWVNVQNVPSTGGARGYTNATNPLTCTAGTVQRADSGAGGNGAPFFFEATGSAGKKISLVTPLGDMSAQSATVTWWSGCEDSADSA